MGPPAIRRSGPTTDLDEGVQPKAGEGRRSGRPARRWRQDDSGDIPSQRHGLQARASPERPGGAPAVAPPSPPLPLRLPGAERSVREIASLPVGATGGRLRKRDRSPRPRALPPRHSGVTDRAGRRCAPVSRRRATAARRSPVARQALAPSPVRMCRSSSGSSRRWQRAAPCAASRLRWPATRCAATTGSIQAAMRAATGVASPVEDDEGSAVSSTEGNTGQHREFWSAKRPEHVGRTCARRQMWPRR